MPFVVCIGRRILEHIPNLDLGGTSGTDGLGGISNQSYSIILTPFNIYRDG